MTTLDVVRQWLQEGDHAEKLLLAVVSSLVVATLTWLRKSIAGGLQGLFARLWNRSPYRAELARYRERLEKDTLRIRHAWMKEEQTLSDILVPVSVESDPQAGGVESLAAVLARHFGPGEVKHLVLTGGPGSGKSVALRLAARQLWTQPSFDEETHRIPVLITFSEYRNSGYQLAAAVSDSLRARGLHPAKGPDQGALAKEFTTQFLRNGRLLVLIDALDELASADRVTAIQRLRTELKEYSSTPVALTCRTAAWHGQLRGLPHTEVRLVDFSPAAIRQFIRAWGFRPPKSSTELLGVIESQPHIGTLARNPLMLTIVAFLYSQPRYRLPENRAQFYEVCSRALLEEWDQHENPTRANQYDRPHKEILLGRLAYEHLCGSDPDRDIEEAEALSSIAEGMHQLGMVRSGNVRMLEEIVLNSGLLVRLPPSGLRFPHQTYMEYFAALHLLRSAGADTLLGHYGKEKNRWREVVLLYCGLNADVAQNSRTIRELLRTDSVETALATLIDARAVDREVVTEVLEVAKKQLSVAPSRALIMGFGSFSANSLSDHADEARGILRDLLLRASIKRISPELLEDLLLACLRRPDEETIKMIIDRAEQLAIRKLLPSMGERAIVMTTKILGQQELSLNKKLEWIEGLRDAGAVRTLYTIATLKQEEAQLGRAAAVALARSSQSNEFWECLEEFDQNSPPYNVRIERVLRRWGWPFPQPSHDPGKKLVFYLALELAEALKDGQVMVDQLLEPDRRIAFLACALYRESGYSFNATSIEELDKVQAAWPGVVRSIWTKSESTKWLTWMRLVDPESGDLQVLSTFPHCIVFLWALLSVTGRLGVPAAFSMFYVAFTIVFTGLFAMGSRATTRKWDNFIFSAMTVPALFAAFARKKGWNYPGVLLLSILLGISYWVVAIMVPANVAFRWLLALSPIQIFACFELTGLVAPPWIATSDTIKLYRWLGKI